MTVQPYLFFDGRCEEALDFYKRALGAEVKSVMRWKDMPRAGDGGGPAAAHPDKIMHASFSVAGADILASDGECQGKATFAGFSLTLNAKGAGEAQRAFAALSDGGTVRMKLGKTFFAESFGMVADKFGVPWIVIAEH